MDVSISVYRNRIGSFNSAKQISYIPEYRRNHSNKSSTRTIFNFRKLFICMVLIFSIITRFENIQEDEAKEDSTQQNNCIGSLTKATDPINFSSLVAKFLLSFSLLCTLFSLMFLMLIRYSSWPPGRRMDSCWDSNPSFILV